MYRNAGRHGHKEHRHPDWTCRCGEENFGSRDKCRKCDLFRSKALAGSAPAPKKGDWICTCGEMNFASRDKCRKCPLARPHPAGVVVPRQEWHCSCGELNFAERTTCRKCGVTPKESKENPAPRPGDWLCGCKVMNFGSRTVCFGCGKAKEVETEVKGGDRKCAICLEDEANVCIEPCGHVVACLSCANKLKSCPACRKAYDPTKDLKRIYIVV